MPIYRLNNSGVWKKIAALYRLNNAGNWRPLSALYRLNNAGNWRQIFSSQKGPEISQQVTISQSTDSEGFVTLTGTNYNWTNATSLIYYFEWSSNNGSSWSTINTGSIANPSSGSSNTKTYLVSSETSPNIDNLYRFRVTASNAAGSTSSTSASTTISTPRDITISFYSKTYDSITVQFPTPAYAGSYNIKIGTSTFQAVLGTVVGGNTRVTATSLASNTSHTITVRPYTGGLGSFGGVAYVKGYAGNESNSVIATTDPAPTPTQTQAPTSPTGNAIPFTNVTIGSTGTYTNRSSVTSSLVKILQGTTITQGGTTALGTVQTSPYAMTQADATIPKFNFYTRDNVVALNGTTYYWYSQSLDSLIGTITDNYNRTVASGLGTSSSQYTYNSYAINLATWSVNGSVAVSSRSIPTWTTSSSDFAMATFEVNDSVVSVSMTAHDAVPSGSLAGYGASIWVTSASNWWAVISTYDSVAYSKTVNTCTTTTECRSSCPASFCGTCTNIGSTSSCTGSVIYEIQSTSTAQPATPNCSGLSNCGCQCCTYSTYLTRYAYSIRSQETSNAYSEWVSVATRTYSLWESVTTYRWSTVQIINPGTSFASYACVANTGSGSSCPTEYVTTYNAANFGKKCSVGCTTTTSTVCGSSQTYDTTSCPTFSSSAAPGLRCSGCTEGSRWVCSATSGRSSCPSYSATPSAGARCVNTNCTTTTTYPCDGYVPSDTSCPSLGNGNGDRCSACNTFYIHQFTYPVLNTCTTTYQYGVSGTTTETGFTYNTRLSLVSSASGSVSYPSWDSPNANGIIKTVDVAGSFNANNHVKIGGLVVWASGDVINAEGSNSAGDSFTALTKTTSGVIKKEADGSSSAGIIKGHTPNLASDGRINSIQI